MSANDDARDAPDRSVTVTATAANGQGIAGNPVAVTLTIRDDDGKPTATLVLSSSSISENGGKATVTATLNRASSQATTLRCRRRRGANAADGDFTLSSPATLTVAAGETASPARRRFAANDDSTDAPNRVGAGLRVREQRPGA